MKITPSRKWKAILFSKILTSSLVIPFKIDWLSGYLES